MLIAELFVFLSIQNMVFDVVCQYKFWPQLQDLPFHRQLPHKNQFFFWINDNRTEENAAIFFHYFKFVPPLKFQDA